MNKIQFPVKLPPPKNEIEEIAYQTLLPYYDPEILNEYNKVHPGMGNRILSMLRKDIDHLENSKKNYEILNKLSVNLYFDKNCWKRHLKMFGWNVSGQYLGNSEY